jgi:hypothetical protein
MSVCPKCNEVKLLNKHSLTGNHKPPFALICRECHDKIHDIRQKAKLNKKFKRGTKRVHKK